MSMCTTRTSRTRFFFQAEVGIRAADVTGVQTCAPPILPARQSFSSVEDLASTLAASYLEPRGGPDLVQVTEELRAQLVSARERPEVAGRSLGEGDVAASGSTIPADQGGESDVTQIEAGPAAAERGGTSRHANPDR